MAIDRAEAVIWIASYPKSGNTWVQAVTRTAGRGLGFPGEDLDVYRLKSEGRAPVVVRGIRPDVSRRRTTVLKTHAGRMPGVEVHPELKLATAGFVYVMRNPLDVLLSYINFTRVQYEKNRDAPAYQQRIFVELLGYDAPVPYDRWVETTLDDIPRSHLDHALDRFGELSTDIPGMKMTGGSWLSHCLSWHEAARTQPAVLLRYEDLLQRPEAFLPLQRLFTFTDAQVLGAARGVDQGLRALQGKRIFFNKMSAYYFRDYFSPAAVERFLGRFERELRQLGYDNLFQRPGETTR